MFDVALINITSTNGLINFTPLGSTRIFGIHFSIILVSGCENPIEMGTICNPFIIKAYIPTILNTANRTINEEYASISLSTPITNNTSDYIRNVFISSFHLTSVGSIVDLRIQGLSLFATNNTQVLELVSLNVLQNVYSKICFSYILINRLNFNYQLAYDTGEVNNPSLPINDNLNISNDFYPYLTKKCIFGYNYLYLGDFPNSSNLTLLFSGATKT
jgi:hypothetical protein